MTTPQRAWVSAAPELVHVSETVRAWVGGGGRSNATLMGCEDLVVCVDALHAPSLAQPVVGSAVDEFGRTPDLLIYSHYHGDHVLGADTIAAPLLMSHANTRAFLAERGHEERARMAAGNPDMAEEILAATVQLPAVVGSDRMSVFVGAVEVAIEYVGPAHTNSDIVFHLPDEGVLVAGDVVVWGVLPVVKDAEIHGWVSALERMAVFQPEWVVPGHGSVASGEAVTELLRLFEHVIGEVGVRFDRSLTVDAMVDQIGLPAPFDAWGRQERFEPLVRKVAEQVAADRGSA